MEPRRRRGVAGAGSGLPAVERDVRVHARAEHAPALAGTVHPRLPRRHHRDASALAPLPRPVVRPSRSARDPSRLAPVRPCRAGGRLERCPRAAVVRRSARSAGGRGCAHRGSASGCGPHARTRPRDRSPRWRPPRRAPGGGGACGCADRPVRRPLPGGGGFPARSRPRRAAEGGIPPHPPRVRARRVPVCSAGSVTPAAGTGPAALPPGHARDRVVAGRLRRPLARAHRGHLLDRAVGAPADSSGGPRSTASAGRASSGRTNRADRALSADRSRFSLRRPHR